jgi:nucleotide-binding universal stress UspA family protein
MFQQVLVPVDFSPVSVNAVQYAARMLASHGGKMRLMHAVNTSIPDPYVPAYYTMDAAKKQSESSNAELESLARSIRADYGIQVEAEVLIGDLSGSLNDLVQKHRTELVVMGTHGVQNWLDRMSGTNTEALVNHLDCPLLVVPDGVIWKPWKNIACATDYSGAEEGIAESLLAYAITEHPQIQFIHVSRPGEKISSFNKELLQQYINRNLNLELIECAGDSVTGSVLETAGARKADLLVVQAMHRDWPDRFLHRSVVRQLAAHPTLPLLIIH